MPDKRTKWYQKGDFSRKVDRHYAIRDFLLQDGEKTFGEIKKHLENIKMQYKTDQGLVYALNSLKDKDRIEQKEKRGTYNLKNTRVDDIRLQGQKFRNMIRQKDYQLPKQIKNKKETLKEYH